MTESTSKHSPEDPVRFDSFGLHPGLMQAIAAIGYQEATPIQASAIPLAMAGRDLMGAAQTGTGKTAAFALPILHRLMPFASASASPARHPVRALILTPTRELAVQVHANLAQYSQFVPLRTGVVYGGVDIRPQRDMLRQGCEVLVATPGRLLDHLEQRSVNLSQVGILVLDEADRMLDMGFLPDLDRIVRLLPPERQGLLFSATFSPAIRKLGRSFLQSPAEVEVARPNATADTVTQVAHIVASEDKRRAVEHLVKSRDLNQVIVFSNTKLGCSRLAHQLARDGIRAQSIHGNKTQRERMEALDAFKSGALEVLVATDVAARGLDIAGVPCVINFDLPHNPEDYVHRIGRTGRAGATGAAIALVAPDEVRYLEDIERLIKVSIPREDLSLPAAPRRAVRGERAAGQRGERARPLRRGRPEGAPRRAEAPRRPAPVRSAPRDAIFDAPYVPAARPAEAASDAAVPATKGKASRTAVGVLLGGARSKPQ